MTFADRIADALAVLGAYSDGLASWVQYWMLFMTVVLNVSLAFVPWRVEARWVLATAFFTPIFAVLFVVLGGKHYVGGFAQVVLWTPLALYLLARRQSLAPPLGAAPAARPDSDAARMLLGRTALGRLARSRAYDAAYRAWLTLVLAIVLVSLGFDWTNVLKRLAG